MAISSKFHAPFQIIEEEKKRKAMESAQKLQLLTDEIQKFIQENKTQEDDETYLDGTDRPILTRLLSQLESLKGEGTPKQSGSSSEATSPRGGESKSRKTHMAKNKSSSSSSKEIDVVEEIGKEIKKVKRQNFITHCLLSALIVVTLAWQVSEVSLALSIKDKLSHPVRSLATAFFSPKNKDRNGGGSQDQETRHPHPPTESGLTMRMPEFPQVDFAFDADDKS